MSRIGIINSTYLVGSTGKMVFDLQTFINNNSTNVAFAYFGRGNRINNFNALNFSYPLSVAFHGFLSRLFDRVGFYSFFSTKRLIKRMKQDAIDTVILMNLHGYYINIKLLFKFLKKKNIRVFYTLHDCWSFTGHCSHFTIFNCEKWKTGCEKCDHLNQYPKSILFDSSKRNYRDKKELFLSVKPFLLLPCGWLQKIVKDSFFKNENSIVIRNGVDTSIFKKTNSDIRQKLGIENKKIILCVSQFWIEKKGIFDIIELSKMLTDEYVVLLVGKLNVSIDLPNNIIHIQQTNNVEEMVDFYSCADVFFNPTYEDTYPTVNIEALACELPIVCYNTGGAVESVDKGFIVEQGDIKRSKELIEDLCCGKKTFKQPNINISKEETYSEYLKLINNNEKRRWINDNRTKNIFAI